MKKVILVGVLIMYIVLMDAVLENEGSYVFSVIFASVVSILCSVLATLLVIVDLDEKKGGKQ